MVNGRSSPGILRPGMTRLPQELTSAGARSRIDELGALVTARQSRASAPGTGGLARRTQGAAWS